MKTALITGGTKGIGYSTAEVLIRNGWNVAITGRNQLQTTQAAEKLNQIQAHKAIGIQADVTNVEQQQQSVIQIIEKFGQLDALIANAGIGYFSSVEKLTHSQWHETINTNLTGVFYSLQACVEELKKTKGYIITIGSLAGNNFFSAGSAYNASKFGLLGFTQAAMLDLRSYGIKVSTIMPGSVATEFNNHVITEKDAWKIQPEDIAQLVMDVLNMNPRTLPSKIEVRPAMPK